jgi:hypothetical protein
MENVEDLVDMPHDWPSIASDDIIATVDEALDSGDYARCLDCWDKFIVKNEMISDNPQLVEASGRIEFTYNLICATHPFRYVVHW